MAKTACFAVEVPRWGPPLAEEPRVMITGLFEAHLPVSDLDCSVAFYEGIGLELAHRRERLALLWIEKPKSWLGLWEADQVRLPYHPSIRHIAFRVELEDLERARAWLEEKGIEVREAYRFGPERQPLVLPDNPQALAAVYFQDPDQNSLELIAPLRIDVVEEFKMMELKDWYLEKGPAPPEGEGAR